MVAADPHNTSPALLVCWEAVAVTLPARTTAAGAKQKRGERPRPAAPCRPNWQSPRCAPIRPQLSKPGGLAREVGHRHVGDCHVKESQKRTATGQQER